MSDAIKKTIDKTIDAVSETGAEDIETLKKDIAVLKKDLAAALKHIRNLGESAPPTIAEQISNEASALYEEVADRTTATAEKIGSKVEEQPITSVLLAFSLGFIISRLTR